MKAAATAPKFSGKLSVVTVCYNAPNLATTCESLVRQTCGDFEWIVVDGGSREETLGVFERYQSRINQFVSEPDRGIYDAMNKGIRMASGEYILFLNSGDSLYRDDVLEGVLPHLNGADVYYGDVEYCGETREIRTFPETLDAFFWLTSIICHQAAFIRADLFAEFGLYGQTYPIAADFEKWLCFYKHECRFVRIPMVVSRFCLDGVSSLRKSRLSAEMRALRKRTFSRAQIRAARARRRPHYTFWERVFSVKDSCEGTHKIVTFLNLRLKFRKK